MPERRHIRVSRSLEGGGERPARRYGVTPSRRDSIAAERPAMGYGEPEAGV